MRILGPLVIALLLAGCTDGEAEVSTASVGTDGEMQDAADCADGDAALTGAGSVDGGTMSVTLTDGEGTEVWSETYDDAFEVEGEAVEGASGTWTLEATASEGFDGTFGLTLTCT